jgi:DNA-binding IclR family transcriptional regulator
LRALTAVHAADGIRVADLTERLAVSAQTARSMVDGLLTCGLVRIDQPTQQ